MTNGHKSHSDRGFSRFAQICGLHPLVAFGMFAIDQMICGLEIGSLFILCLVSWIVGVALIVPCIIIQKYAYKEEWGAAIGKGFLVGLLTAVPGSFFSVGTAFMGILGTMAMLKRPREIGRTVIKV